MHKILLYGMCTDFTSQATVQRWPVQSPRIALESIVYISPLYLFKIYVGKLKALLNFIQKIIKNACSSYIKPLQHMIFNDTHVYNYINL